MCSKQPILFFILCFVLSIFQPAFSQTSTYDVIKYEINLDVNHSQAQRHIGFTKINLNIISAQNNVLEFDLKNHVLDSVVVNQTNTAFDYDGNKIRVSLTETPSVGENFEIVFYYNGSTVLEPYSWGGMHYTPNIIYNLGIAFADYPHSYGRSWFVCKDSFTDKAAFKFHITVNKDVKAVCGGILDSISQGIDSDTYHWSLNQEIAPYLASVSIADFRLLERELESEYRNIPLQVFYFESDSAAVYKNFENFELAFSRLEECFGPFAFNRAGYSTTPQGSMEHVDNISLARSLATSYNLNSQSVIVHEFGHSWFGNLMTCKTAGDMWINEGWTTFTERLSLEAIHGSDYAKNHFRKKAESVIKTLPQSEGVFALYDVDSTRTYSSTVYDKGALVAMSLKAYMGDSLFYSSVKKLLSDFAFSNMDSYTMRDSLSAYSGINLNDFFDYYVFDTMMHHFVISYFEAGENSADIKIQSRTAKNDNLPCLNARLPITFMDADFNTCKRQIIDNGTESTHSFSLPFTPIAAFLDFDEEFFDLTTDSYKKISENGLHKFENSYVNVVAADCQDTVLVRATLHWVGEKENKQQYGINRFSKRHYWTIEGVNLEKANLNAKFYYQLSSLESSFDNTLIHSSADSDSLLLLYRPNVNAPWEIIEFNKPTSLSGYITAPLRQGDYIMAVGDKEKVGLSSINKSANTLKIYPQPSNGKITVELPELNSKAKLSILDSAGRILYSVDVKQRTKKMSFDFNFPKGNYILSLSANNSSLGQSFIIE